MNGNKKYCLYRKFTSEFPICEKSFFRYSEKTDKKINKKDFEEFYM